MAILLDRNSRIVIQGITGSEGSFHGRQCLDYGSTVVAGVTPGRGGQQALDGSVPVYNTCHEAREETAANVALIFVPAPFAGDAILEAAEAGIELIICITEGIPTQDMLRVKTILGYSRSRLIGPNCPGILSPDESKAGIMPGSIAKKGSIGVISRSGTLTYEAVQQLVEVGFGQSSCIGIGGDPIIGSSMVELLECFETDQETEAVLLIGEIGGQIEVEAAYYVKNSMCKPVFGFIAGRTAPPGRRMGHAGAIISGTDESAQSKMKIMQDLGIGVIESPAEIGRTVKKGLAECSLVRTSSG